LEKEAHGVHEPFATVILLIVSTDTAVGAAVVGALTQQHY